LSIINVLAG